MKSAEMQQKALIEFDRLIELSDSERVSALASLQKTDAALAQAVEALLQADADQSGVLDRGVEAIVAQVATPHPEVQSALAEQSVGAFTLKRPLGRGGMGEVWLAERRAERHAERQDGAFVQQAALKLLKRGMDSDAISARFLQERRILAELNHPHIARFIDGGISDDGRLYFAMEYVDGLDICAHSQRNNLSISERVQLITQVTEAIAHAQSHLIVHRDLKPSNVFVDTHGQPRVLDFGIAKLLTSDRGTNATELVHAAPETSTGAMLMSPAYAAPEQILGEAISTATDVYALGVILFELLTGQRPHLRDGASFKALMAQAQTDITSSPSALLKQQSNATRTWKQINQDLDTIVMTALKRDPARRYRSAQALADDLKRWQQGKAIAAQPDTRTYRIKRFVARNRLAVGSASAVFLALLVGLSVALWQAGVAREQANRAKLESLNAARSAQLSQEAELRTSKVKEFLMQTFAASDPMRRTANAPKTATELFEEALKRIDSPEITADSKLQMDLLDDFGEIRFNQGRVVEAAALIERALRLGEQRYGLNDPAIAESLLNLSIINSQTGKRREALQMVARARSILERVQSEQPMQYANALNINAQILVPEGKIDEAVALMDKALTLTRKHQSANNEQFMSILHSQSMLLNTLGRAKEAEPLAREALQEAEALYGNQSPRISVMLIGYAAILERLNRKQEAITLSERSLRILRNTFPNGHPDLARALFDHGAQFGTDKPEQAMQLFNESIEMYSKLDDSRIIFPLQQRGLMQRDHFEDKTGALRDFARALQMCEMRQSKMPLCQSIRAEHAGVLASLGQGSLALSEAEATLQTLTERSRMKGPEYAQALEAKAAAHFALGQQAPAIAEQAQALALMRTLHPEDHKNVQRARKRLAEYEAVHSERPSTPVPQSP